MAFAIHKPEQRQRLEVRAKPYFIRLADGLHLGYRKGKTVSRWVVRTSTGGRYRLETVKGVEPDDQRAADGLHVLDFQQMVNRIMTQTNSPLCCSFCGKDQTQVAKLVAGPGVYICDACVALCQIYIDNPDRDGKLLIEDGRAVIRDGAPVWVPLTEDERRQRDALRDGSAQP